MGDSNGLQTVPEADELLVNYEDAVIYGRDWKLVVGCGWLNDACIHYQLKRLEQQYTQQTTTVLLLDPAVVSFLVHQADADDRAEYVLQNLGPNIEQVLIPINDSMDDHPDWWSRSGSHWTLLHWKRSPPSRLFHYDSTASSRANLAAAQTVASILGAAPGATVQPIAVPQQTNGYDCGIHVLAAVEHILQGREDVANLFRDGGSCYSLRQRIAADILVQSALYRQKD